MAKSAKLTASETGCAELLLEAFLDGQSDDGGNPLVLKGSDKVLLLKNEKVKFILRSKPVAGSFAYNELMVTVKVRCVHLLACLPARLPACLPFDVILM